MKTVTEHLLALADAGNAAFTARLAPGVDPDRMLGCRIPQLRRLARTLRGTPEAAAFLTQLPHRYYDENNLHGILLGHIRPTGEALDALERFLPHVDNWATCDALRPKAFKKHPSTLPDECRRWIKSGEIYAVRFGIEMLMTHYLDADFRPEYLEEVSIIKSKEYYVNMMITWYFATALAKQYEAAVPYIEQRCLAPWTHNKTIRKAIESYRITDEQKAYLRTLAIRE